MGEESHPRQESRPTFLQVDFRDVENVAQLLQHAEAGGRGHQRRAGQGGR